jgi:hypothetical protein
VIRAGANAGTNRRLLDQETPSAQIVNQNDFRAVARNYGADRRAAEKLSECP